MSFTLTLRKEAEFDVEEHFDYYEEIRNGLGQDFLLCVEEALDKILNYRIIYKKLRRISIRRFPHRIFFLVQDQYVIVTAMFHARKNPKSWSSRI